MINKATFEEVKWQPWDAIDMLYKHFFTAKHIHRKDRSRTLHRKNQNQLGGAAILTQNSDMYLIHMENACMLHLTAEKQLSVVQFQQTTVNILVMMSHLITPQDSFKLVVYSCLWELSFFQLASVKTNI